MNHWTAWGALGFFALSYVLVVLEDKTHLRKSVPMIVAAGVLWILAAISPVADTIVEEKLSESILEYSELFLFILAAVSYVHTMEERQVFDVLRAWLIKRGLSYRGIFWATGALAFCMSPLADNLTTALVLGAVAISVGANTPRFVVPACINIVVAANAGGAFSPFGDITTLMVWQRGLVDFAEFLRLFIPSVVNWLVPAFIMSFAVPKELPKASSDSPQLLIGAKLVIGMFLGTIAFTVVLHQFLHLPPMLGMMTGFGALHLYGYFLRRSTTTAPAFVDDDELRLVLDDATQTTPRHDSFDLFELLNKVSWDTLMFFYGVMLCVGALDAFGFLDAAVHATYGSWGPTAANTALGIASAVLDNIPLMAGVLAATPEMNTAQWLLATLTAGVGGSLLSVGSAAGVALMGQARGIYTFSAHLRWTWAVALGFAASIGLHLLLNGR
ncbi:MAG TPA: sodium:proton antiporter NhaD [Gemmatimonadaceae bacterium]|nr:sodium:proton antiporter NhaD [Gemmatimonadaceae bacterium]